MLLTYSFLNIFIGLSAFPWLVFVGSILFDHFTVNLCVYINKVYFCNLSDNPSISLGVKNCRKTKSFCSPEIFNLPYQAASKGEHQLHCGARISPKYHNVAEIFILPFTQASGLAFLPISTAIHMGLQLRRCPRSQFIALGLHDPKA